MSEQITPNPSVPSQIVQELKFPKFINNLGIIPTSYKDSMSYYECLAWLCKFLEETVIPTVNENGEAVEELQNLYVELNSYVTNYFKNLDVQEEINNKLDEMVEAGTLQEIISEYLNSIAIFGFNTVADMKEATNLINGSYARTLGYYSKNDGGSGLYKIRNRTFDDIVNNGSIILMENENIVAELIENNYNVKQFGAYGDNIHNDSDSFNNIIDFANTFRKKIYIPNGNYLINSNLHTLSIGIEIIGSNDSLKFDNCCIIDNRNSDDFLFEYDIIENENYTGGGIQNITLINNTTERLKKCIHIKASSFGWDSIFKNLHIDEYDIAIKTKGNDTKFQNCLFSSCSSNKNNQVNYAIELYDSANEQRLSNCHFEHCRYPIHITDTAFLNYLTDSKIEMSTKNLSYAELSNPVLIDSTNDSTPLTISNCSFVNLDISAYSNENNSSFNYNSVPYFLKSTSQFISIDNSNFLLGLGSSEQTFNQRHQGKFLYLDNGNVTNCNFIRASYFTFSIDIQIGNFSNNTIFTETGGTYNCAHNNNECVVNNASMNINCNNNLFKGFYVHPYAVGGDYKQRTPSKTRGTIITPVSNQSYVTYVLEPNISSAQLMCMLECDITMLNTSQIKGKFFMNTTIAPASSTHSIDATYKIAYMGSRTVYVSIKDYKIYIQFAPSGTNQILMDVKGYEGQLYSGYYDSSITTLISDYDRQVTFTT